MVANGKWPKVVNFGFWDGFQARGRGKGGL
jgi:hypothetical protein